MAAAAAANAGSGGLVINFHKNSEIGQVAPSCLGVGNRFSHRGTCSTTMKNIDRRGETAVEKKKGFGEWGKEEGVVYEKMDEWMKQSVVDIVKNLREAPLLVHVYNGGQSTTTHKAVEEGSWVHAIDMWKTRKMPMPEGVIFVEQLEDQTKKDNDDGVMTKAWGIVVQGRGCQCGPLCYLLKTTRGSDGAGLGLCCTHFCLIRVQSFTQSARSQLQNCWLN